MRRTTMQQSPVEHQAPMDPNREVHWNESVAALVKMQEWVNMSSCHLTHIPVGNLRRGRPTALNLDYNHLIDLPIELGNIASLESISLNSQTAVPRASISKRSHLQSLPEDIGRLPKLRMLLLSQNNVERLPQSLAMTNTLCVLDLRLNNLQYFPEHVCSIRSLKQLLLSGNEIREIPEAIGDLSHLEVLRVANNRLFCLPDSIGNLTQLRTLSLRHNQLHRLPRVLFRLRHLGASRMDTEGQALGGLLLDNNPWEYPPAEVVKSGTKVVIDYLHTHDIPSGASAITMNMSFRKWPKMLKLPGDPADIVAIDARESGLFEIPPEATSLPNLNTLILDRNAIPMLSEDTLKKMRSLTGLSLQNQYENSSGSEYTRLQSIHEIVVCENLTELYVGQNWITSLPSGMQRLTKLRILDLAGNGLREFPAKLCEHLVALEFLGLSSNVLQELPSEIGCLTKLKVLRLSKNQLRALPDTICTLSNLHTLSVRENRLFYLPLDLHNLQRLSGHDQFRHMHASFSAELKVGSSPEMTYPDKNICEQGTAAIFNYLRNLARNPREKSVVQREIRGLLDNTKTSSHSSRRS